jgi:hypothetical protein
MYHQVADMLGTKLAKVNTIPNPAVDYDVQETLLIKSIFAEKRLKECYIN